MTAMTIPFTIPSKSAVGCGQSWCGCDGNACATCKFIQTYLESSRINASDVQHAAALEQMPTVPPCVSACQEREQALVIDQRAAQHAQHALHTALLLLICTHQAL